MSFPAQRREACIYIYIVGGPLSSHTIFNLVRTAMVAMALAVVTLCKTHVYRAWLYAGYIHARLAKYASNTARACVLYARMQDANVRRSAYGPQRSPPYKFIDHSHARGSLRTQHTVGAVSPVNSEVENGLIIC